MESLKKTLNKRFIRYSESTVRILIKAGRKSKERFNPKYKEIILYMLKDLILKATNNFLRINKFRSNDAPFDEEDIILECYLVLEHCLGSFKLEMRKSFYLYYNRSLSTRISRIAGYRWVYHPKHIVESLDRQIDEQGHELIDLLVDPNSNDNTEMLMILSDMEKLGITYDDIQNMTAKGIDQQKRKQLEKIRLKLKKYYDE